MARAFYSEYVNHCLRFYARHTNPKFKSDADKQNWKACESAINSFSDKEQVMLLGIYRGEDSVPDKVYQLAHENGVKTDTIWKLINELERKVAKRRGLL